MGSPRIVVALYGTAAALIACAGVATAQPSSEPQIIGGDRAKEGPWAVAIMVNGQQNCSGSIVAEKWVITAEHCDNANNQFLIGNVDREAGESRSPVTSVPHPSADIILYELDSPVETTYAELAETAPARGDTEQVYGYGRTENSRDSRYLKVADMTITAVGSEFIDAREGDGYTGPGDSGGPVFVDGKLVGVHSYGDTDAGTSGHTNVATYRDWILQNIG